MFVGELTEDMTMMRRHFNPPVKTLTASHLLPFPNTAARLPALGLQPA